MPRYRVTWEIDMLDCEDPIDAAHAARGVQYHGTASFTVRDEQGNETVVDLGEHGGDPLMHD